MSNSTDFLAPVRDALIYYPVLVALPIGVLGNIFSFYIYTRPNLNKKTNTGFLYAWLCIFNLIFMLYFVFVLRATNSLFAYSLFGYWVFLPCGLMTYFLRIIYCLVPWMQVIISFDRFFLVVYPHKSRILTKKWIFYLAMLAILIVLALANMANLITYNSDSGNLGANTTCTISYQAGVASNILTILLRAYLPFGLMLFFNVNVYRNLKNSKARSKSIAVKLLKLRSMSSQLSQVPSQKSMANNQMSNRQYNFIVSTLFIDLTFIIFYTPIVAHVTITTINLFVKWDTFSGYVFGLYYFIALLCSYLYCIVILFIFVIFNRYFRNEIIELLRLRKIWPNLDQTIIVDSTSTVNKNNKNENDMKY